MGKSFLKQMLFHSSYEVSIGFGGTAFFLKWCWGGRGGDKKVSGGGGGNLPLMMPYMVDLNFSLVINKVQQRLVISFPWVYQIVYSTWRLSLIFLWAMWESAMKNMSETIPFFRCFFDEFRILFLNSIVLGCY